MKKIILMSLSTILISACSSTPPREHLEPRVVEHVEYIVKIPPADLIKIPSRPETVNVDEATQKDAARLIAALNNNIQVLENTVAAILQFLKDEQIKLDNDAELQNSNGNSSGIASK